MKGFLRSNSAALSPVRKQLRIELSDVELHRRITLRGARLRLASASIEELDKLIQAHTVVTEAELLLQIGLLMDLAEVHRRAVENRRAELLRVGWEATR